MFSLPESKLFFLRATSAMQFTMCPLLIMNHLISTLTKLTYSHSSSGCTVFAFYSHSVAFQRFFMKSRIFHYFCVLSLKSMRISDTL